MNFFPNDLTRDLGISLELSPHNQMKEIVNAETLFTAVVTKITIGEGLFTVFVINYTEFYFYNLSANQQVQSEV